jgi:hypothetical protein
MNAIENLRRHHREVCEPCIINSKIIEFNELPEKLKYEFCDYNDELDFLLHCKKCGAYFLIPTDLEILKMINNEETNTKANS